MSANPDSVEIRDGNYPRDLFSRAVRIASNSPYPKIKIIHDHFREGQFIIPQGYLDPTRSAPYTLAYRMSMLDGASKVNYRLDLGENLDLFFTALHQTIEQIRTYVDSQAESCPQIPADAARQILEDFGSLCDPKYLLPIIAIFLTNDIRSICDGKFGELEVMALSASAKR